MTNTGRRARRARADGAAARASQRRKRPHGVRADRRQPLAAALAADAKHVGLEVQVALLEPDHLADPQPGRVHRLQDRPVAQSHERFAGRRGPSRRPTSSAGEEVGQVPRPCAGCAAAWPGWSSTQPSRWPKRKKLRREASRRAIVLLA